MGMSRSAWYRPPRDRMDRDREVIDALSGLASANGRWGFWKCFDRLRLDGKPWNHKRVWRVYTELRLNHTRRTKKRVPKRPLQPMTVLPLPNEVWSIDFMHDTLYVGKRFRTLNVLDEGVREALEIEVDTSLSAARLVRVMERLKDWRGLPKAIRCDNGAELTSHRFTDWCRDNNVELRHIQPGKPNQNAYIERFNRSYREEVLNAYLFEDLDQVRAITQEWMETYNEVRPHDALGSLPPAIFRRMKTAELSGFVLSP